MWIPIALELLKWLGPLIAKWFAAWLAKRMEEASERLPSPTTFSGTKDQHLALLREVYDSTSWLQPAKKIGVGKIIDAVQDHADLASISETQTAMIVAACS